MKKIAIQSGHMNTTNGQTGAPRELERTIAIGQRLFDLLTKAGYVVTRCDANANNNSYITTTDWDLFISLHCDANYAGDQGGGFVDFPDPSIDDSTKESKRIKEAIESVYFQETGIRNVPSRSNSNTKFYYMWTALSPKTPCVLIEMGESIDPHDNVILNDKDRVAKAILKGIVKALPLEIVTPPVPLQDIEKLKARITDLEATEQRLNRNIKEKDLLTLGLHKTIEAQRDKLNGFQAESTKLLAELRMECEQKKKDLLNKLREFINTV